MANCIPCIYIKHATLIENCYPPLKEGGITPRSSELSYLTFYASSRPAKLTKVGAYIQNRVERDIRKGRKSHNLVSLKIIKALIQTCHRDLNIFSKYVIKILSMLLNTRDLETIDTTCETFIVFCSYHDGSTLGVDMNFTTDYENLLGKFSNFCYYTNEDAPLLIKMQYIGHRAIQAAVASSALQAPDFKAQVSILFLPLITTLASSKKTLWESSDYTNIDIRDSAVGKNDIDPHVIGLLATHTIATLFSNVTGSSVRRSTTPLFQYMDKKETWRHSELAVNIMNIALHSVQPQYRYLLVSDLLQQLESTEEENDKQVAMVLILEAMLTAHVPLPGISVLEVLNTLFNRVTISAKQKHSSAIQNGLVSSIGGLATQIYYDQQLNDMISYLVSKLRTNTLLERVDGMLLYEYRVLVMRCLDSIVTNASQRNDMRMEKTDISLDVWVPALDLLKDKHPHTRIAFGNCLSHFLDNVSTSLESKDGYPRHTFTKQGDGQFMNQLVHTMYDWVQMANFNLTDLKWLHSLLCLVTRQFGVDATVASVPFVFKVQQMVQEGIITQVARQRAVEAALIDWLLFVSQHYSVGSLADYARTLAAQGASNSHLVSASLEEPTPFPTTDTAHQRVWIDRSLVVDTLSKCLRDKSDTHGLELEAKLFAEWGFDTTVRKDPTTITKPRLASPWETKRAPIQSDDKRNNSIRVVHLKEALAGPCEDDDADTNSSRSKSIHLMKPLPIKPADMNTLLHELNLSQHSTVSLVNPPY